MKWGRVSQFWEIVSINPWLDLFDTPSHLLSLLLDAR